MSTDKSTEAPSTAAEVVPEYPSDFAGLAPGLEKLVDAATSGLEHLPSTISLDSPAAIGLSYSEYKYKPTYEIDRRGNIIS